MVYGGTWAEKNRRDINSLANAQSHQWILLYIGSVDELDRYKGDRYASVISPMTDRRRPSVLGCVCQEALFEMEEGAP
jgi:hypothetical protein